MLANLHIENIAVIKNLDIDLNSGFTVFTGETGAGKSIIINSINLLCGEKAQKDMIRTGEDEATVSALFQNVPECAENVLSEYGLPLCDGEIYITRSINNDGKTTVKINGKTAPLYVLKEISSVLLTLHGQHSSYRLLEQKNYLEYLDGFSDCSREYDDYIHSYEEYKKERAVFKALSKTSKEKGERVELLKIRVKEIDALKLKPGEEDELTEQRTRIKNIEHLTKHIKLISRALYKNSSGMSASDLMNKASESFSALADLTGDEKYQESAKKLSDFTYEIEDIVEGARSLLAGIDEDPNEALDRIESRLDKIASLKRKYGVDADGLIKLKDESLAELSELDNSEILIKESKERLVLLSEKCKNNAAILSQKRKDGAKSLQKLICDELAELDMGQLRFIISVEDKNEYDETGVDSVDFLISTNKGEDARPVNKIASGGELSRIMLAMRSVFRQKNNIDTIIYDEIDTGISGGTCEKIGRKLKNSSLQCQVICITHSAQIAAVADNHYRIYKETIDERTETKITLLSNEERIKELSRIMGGVTISESVLAAAREMIENGTKNGTVTGI